MKNLLLYSGFLLAGLLLTFACSRKATDYRNFLEGGELIYPGKVGTVAVYPGNGRLMLKWASSPDPNVAKYGVYWNNRKDSVMINATSHNPADSVSCIINNLGEYNYSFLLYSFDNAGNRSVVTEVNNAHSYGAIYGSGLYNRLPAEGKPFVVNGDGSVILYFTTPDTINITTKISYKDAAGVAATAFIAPNKDSVILPSLKFGDAVVYQSSYIPVRNAIDTFLTGAVDTFPEIFRILDCNKGLFAKYDMWGDMSAWESGTATQRLWDGSTTPQGWPDVFHSGGGAVPGTFSFDMGKVYNRLAEVDETGRNCCHNPLEFEIWGIEDITNAIPPLNPTDGNWANEMRNKGWTLLTTAIRNDDGVATRKFTFNNNIPPVRYIRVRVLKTATTDGYVNLSELTFRYRE
jgi:hypothetical protein